jgi:hypothetical protein
MAHAIYGAIFGRMLKGENMSYFSDELQKLILERNVKIYVLAAVSGIDRTLIHKILKGDRIPSSRAVVQKLASVLLLTPEETDHLIQNYQLTKMGEENYSRRKNIEDFINDFNEISQLNHISVKTDYHHRIDALPDNATVYGSLEINNLVKTVIELEVIKDSGCIKAIAQPEYTFLFHLLALTGMNQHGWKIDHIICLENLLNGKDSLYNLNCFRTIMPIFLSGCHYNPMCYYNNPSHISSTSMMPYLLVTSSYVINISYDISYATISGSPQYLELYSRIFDDFVKKSVPMLTIFSQNQVEKFPASIFPYGCLLYSFSYDPQLLSFMPEKIRTEYLHCRFFQQDNMTIPEQILNPKDRIKTEYFTEEGLDRFLINQELFSPLEITDRYNIFKKMYEAALEGNYHPLLINPSTFNTPKHLSVFVFQNAIVFILMLSGNKLNLCIIEEKSLVYAFHDFFKHLPESNSVLSKEETLSIMKSKLDQSPRI